MCEICFLVSGAAFFKQTRLTFNRALYLSHFVAKSRWLEGSSHVKAEKAAIAIYVPPIPRPNKLPLPSLLLARKKDPSLKCAPSFGRKEVFLPKAPKVNREKGEEEKDREK